MHTSLASSFDLPIYPKKGKNGHRLLTDRGRSDVVAEWQMAKVYLEGFEVLGESSEDLRRRLFSDGNVWEQANGEKRGKALAKTDGNKNRWTREKKGETHGTLHGKLKQEPPQVHPPLKLLIAPQLPVGL